MQVKQGKLLSRLEQLPSTRAMGRYVTENATVTIYQPSEPSMGLYTLLSFATGCVLGVALFTWQNDVYSSDVELSLLRSTEPSAAEHISLFILPNKAEAPPSLPGKNPTANTPLVKRLTEVPELKKLLIQQGPALSIEVSQSRSYSLDHAVNGAIMLAKTQSFKLAENTLLSQYQRGNTNQSLLNALGALYSKKRQWKKAALSYSRACQDYIPNALCFYNLAVSYDHLKNHSKAIEAYQRALSQGGGAQGFEAAAQRRVRELGQW